MASDTSFIVGPAVAAIAAGWVKLPLNLVQGNEIAAVLKVTIRAVAVSRGRLHFNLVGVTVIAEGTFVAGGAEPVIGRGIEAVVLDESGCVTE